MKYLKYYNSIMDYLTDTRLYPAVSMIYEKDDSSKFQSYSYIFNHIINVSDLPYTMFPYRLTNTQRYFGTIGSLPLNNDTYTCLYNDDENWVNDLVIKTPIELHGSSTTASNYSCVTINETKYYTDPDTGKRYVIIAPHKGVIVEVNKNYKDTMKIALVNATNMNQFYEGWTDYIIAENSLLKSEQIISTANRYLVHSQAITPTNEYKFIWLKTDRIPYITQPYFDINSVSSVLSNNENEGISTLSLNDLETIKIIVEEDS